MGDGSTAPAVSALSPEAAARVIEGPYAFWDWYYATHDDEGPDIVYARVHSLGKKKQYVEAEAVLWNYLKRYGKNAQSWMYQSLAVMMDFNKRDPARIKEALGHAADLAERSRDMPGMLLVADLLFARGERDRVAKLIDAAIKAVPFHSAPLLKSLAFAQETKDLSRMTAGLEPVFSLGWPGVDPQVRAEADRLAKKFAEALRKEGRDSDADALLDALEHAEERDLVVRLSWEGDADLDLTVREPDGGACRMMLPVTIMGGSLINNGYGKDREEFYVVPRAFDGTYAATVEAIYNNPKDPAKDIEIEVIHREGSPRYERKESFPVTLGAGAKPVEIVVKEGRRKEVLPYKGVIADLNRAAEAQTRVRQLPDDPKEAKAAGDAPAADSAPKAEPAAKP